MAELKPCPFCGSEAARSWGVLDSHEVYCIGCHATIKRDGMEEAIEAWNRRASDG